MSTFLRNLCENDEPVTLEKILFSLFGITIIRTFFENFSSPNPDGYFFSWKDTCLEFPIYYTSVFLSFALILHFFSKKSFNKIINFEIKVFLFALLPPIVDLLATHGKGSPMSYIVTEPQNILSAFFETMNPLGFSGITFGIHVAAYLILSSMALFTYQATKNFFKSISVVLIGYCILFLYAITPSLIAMPTFFSSNSESISAAYHATVQQSWLATTQEQSIADFSFLQFFNPAKFQNETTTRTFFLLLLFQLALLFFIFKPKFFTAIKNNLRLERILFWSIIATIGIVLNQRLFGPINFSNTINIIILAIFFSLIALNAWLAICINDAEDIAIDEVSNPNRPLVKKEVSIGDWKKFQTILTVLVVLGTAIMNHAAGFLLILAQMAYYLYSAKPLRLKKHFLTSSILIGIASVAISMAGFFLVSPDQHLSSFPIQAVIIIGFSFALISNFKDIKDFKGDNHAGIQTIPVVFGLENSRHIIATLFALVMVIVPLSLNLYTLLFPTLLMALFTYYLFIKKEYQEKYVFSVFFLYMLTLFLATL